MALRFDPEFIKAFASLLGGAAAPPPPNDAHEVRASNDSTLAFANGFFAPTPDIEETIFHYSTKDGTSLAIYRFVPESAKADPATPKPAIVFIHGGGFISGSVELFKGSIKSYASGSGVTTYAVSYRLAPEFPFPTPVEDAYAAIEWVVAHAAEHNIDPARIGICGNSAGGGIAAGVTLMARDKGLAPPLAKQILIYPMLDDRTEIADDSPLAPFLTWNMAYQKIGWGAYVGADRKEVSPYAAPGRVADVSGLPRTYIDVGGLDLFRDEDIAYAARLAAANVEVEFHLYPGLPHGFDMARDIPATKRAEQNRILAMSDF